MIPLEYKPRLTCIELMKISFALCAFFVAIVWYIYFIPYRNPQIAAADTTTITTAQPTGQYVAIPAGTSASATGALLEQLGVIPSARVFTATLQTTRRDDQVVSGRYFFTDSHNLYDVISRITSAQYGLPTTPVALFAGEAVYRYADRISAQLPTISSADFVQVANDWEGYLLPGTYDIPYTATAQDIVDMLRDNFEQQTAMLQSDAQAQSQDWADVIIMASIIESEAGIASYQTKQKVSGVLWHRINQGMLLQADAVFSFIYQQHIPRILFRHLEVDSPYNVYKHRGLPPGPIGNPSIDSIRAALDPVNPERYVYYLTGTDGKFYYAKTLAAHERNRRLHLRY